jgi:hypothetical protein
MAERGSTIARAHILSVFEDFREALCSLLNEGASVSTPFANFSLSLKDVFNGNTDVFDGSRFQITPAINAGSRLRSFYRQNLSL